MWVLKIFAGQFIIISFKNIFRFDFHQFHKYSHLQLNIIKTSKGMARCGLEFRP